MMISPHKVMEQAALITYGASASTAVLWGMHVSDIAMIISASAAVGGFIMQIYVAVTKVRLMHRSQRWETAHRHDGEKK